MRMEVYDDGDVHPDTSLQLGALPSCLGSLILTLDCTTPHTHGSWTWA